jgi:hypothetical protein
MARTSHTPLAKTFNPAMLENVSLQGKVYIVRILFSLTTLALLAFNDGYCRERPGDHLWLFVGGLIYPQLGHLLFGRLDIRRHRGHVLFLADGMFVGAVMAALEYALVPSIVLVIINLFNWMVVGGAILVTAGILFMVIGMLTIGTGLDMLSISSPASCPVTNWLACLISIGYFLAVARIIHILIGDLRLQQVGFQARSDSANSARKMAEQALLAVLPASAAYQMAEKGSVESEILPQATLLLIDFRSSDDAFPELEAMQDALLVCDLILARHGIELIKSFGNRALALSRKESGPDDAFKAFLEIFNFHQNHNVNTTSLRGILHHGRVTVGLVQPQRLNLDLLGPTIEEIVRLADETAARHLPGLIITAAANAKMGNYPDRNQILLKDSQLICYQYSI